MARSVLKDRNLNGREIYSSVIGPVQFLIRKILEHCSEHIVTLKEESSVGNALPRCTV